MEKNIFYRAGCLELPQIRAETQTLISELWMWFLNALASQGSVDKEDSFKVFFCFKIILEP